MTTIAEGLRSAEIEVARLNFEAVQSAITASIAGASIASVPDLVRLAHRKTPRSESFLASFQAPFYEADSTLLLDGEDELGAALSCLVLTELFQAKSKDRVTHAVAMLISAASFLQWQPKVPDLANAAAAHLQSAGHDVRHRRPVPTIGRAFRGFNDAIKAIEAACEGNSVAGMKEPLPAALRSLHEGAQILRTAANTAVIAVDKNQGRTDEELDIYWWVASGNSHLLKAPLSEAPKAAVPLIAGIELGDLVAFVPGPPAAEAYLATILRAAKLEATGAPLEDAVMDLPDVISLEVPSALRSHPEFCPLAFAVTRHREAGDASWKSAFASQIALDPSKALKPVSLSVQAYNERFLSRLVGDDNG